MKEIPDDLLEHIIKCADNYISMETSLADIYNAKIFDGEVEGSGFCIKIETKGITNEKAGKNKIIIEFSISDGEYNIPAIVHNADAKYLEGAIDKNELTRFLKILTKSQKQGKRVEIKGEFH